MKKPMYLASVAAIALIGSLSALSASAEVVTFENLSPGSCAFIGSSAASGAFSFAAETGGNSLFACDAFVNGKNTSRALVDANGTANTAMTRTGGGSFSLSQFEAGSRSQDFNGGNGFTSQSAAAIRVTGELTGGGTVVEDFLFTGTDLGTFTLSSLFSDVVKVNFLGLSMGNASFIQPEFVLDNIVAGDASHGVPEPGTLLLAGTMLAALGLRRRAR